MSMEAETGEMIVRVALDGIERSIRLTGSAAMLSGKLLIFLAAALSKNKARDIALNPGGMCTVTIPEKNLKDFAKLAKKYHLQYFVAKDRLHEKGLQDVCVRAEDAGIVNRICEKIGINAIEKSTGSIEKLTSFDNAKEAKSYVSVSFDRALNRITERDFSKNTPRYICERTNPGRYIELTSKLEEYNGESYTKTNYSVYKDGEKIGEFHDGRFDGRQRSYWQKQKSQMKEAGGFSDDIVFFDEAGEFNHYRKLYDVKDMGKPISADELKQQVEKEIDSLLIKDDSLNPKRASDIKAKIEEKVSGAGAKGMDPEKNPIHKFVDEYKKAKVAASLPAKAKVKDIVR